MVSPRSQNWNTLQTGLEQIVTALSETGIDDIELTARRKIL